MPIQQVSRLYFTVVFQTKPQTKNMVTNVLSSLTIYFPQKYNFNGICQENWLTIFTLESCYL